MTRRYFEDFSAGHIFELGSVSFTDDEIIAFARLYDPQPMHVDPVLASQSIYGGLIASGWHTVAGYMRLLVDHVMLGSESLGSPGIDQLRWVKPVRPRDVLRCRYTVLETKTSRSRPDWGIVRGRGEMTNQANELVMHFEAVNFFLRKPA
jgi:acyl dehydratase